MVFLDRLMEMAAARPDALCVSADGRQADYHDIAARVGALAAQIAARRIGPGSVAVTRVADPILDLVVMLALLHEGVAQCSVTALGAAHIDIAADLVVADAAALPDLQRALSGVPCIAADGGFTPAPLQPKIADPGFVAQILLTSGTTAAAKMVPLTRGALVRRTAVRAGYFPSRGGCLCLMPIAAAGGLQTCLSALDAGIRVDLSTNTDAQVASATDPGTRQIVGSPAQFLALMAALKAAGRTAPQITDILLMGGDVTDALIAAAQPMFGGPVVVLYGTTELGACAAFGSNRDGRSGRLRLLPGVEAAAFADDGTRLPDGASGSLRFRAPGMAASYYGNPALTAECYVGGWFSPGDIGSVEDEEITLQGRRDEVINLAGIKYDPARIDHFIAAQRLATDAAAFRFVDPAGAEHMVIAAVVSDDASYDRLRAAIRQEIGAGQFPVGFFRVTAIPRTAMGKPMRGALADQMLAVLARKPG